MTDAHSDLEDYPGWFSAKLPLWRRKWLHVTGASLLAFMVGLGVGGADAPDGGTMSIAKARTLADQAAKEAKADAESNVLANPEVVTALDDERSRSATALAEVQAKADAAQQQVKKLQKEKAAALKEAADARDAASEAAASAPAASEPAAAPASSSGGTDPRFSTCGEANDHGYGSYVRGQDPEYDWYQDRDHDGVVCEY